MATLTVGSNKQFATIAAAVTAARDGDVVQVQAGAYVNDFATTRSRISLVAVGGQVTMLATAKLAAGKAILTVTTDATIDGFVFADAQSADGTAAGLLDTGGNLVLKNSLFIGNQNGLVAAADANGTVLIQASEFSANGNNDGFSHNIAIGAVKSLTIQDSYIHDALGGDEVKSRAHATTITGTRILDNASNALASLDLPNGGTAIIRNSTLEKGANATLAALVRNGADAAYAGSSLSISGSTLLADRAGAVAVQNTAATAVNVTSNMLFGFTGAVLSGGGTASGNTIAQIRPVLAASSIILPALALPAEPGRAGAVLANGTTLTVGTGGAYTSLAAALAVAHDGDTIRLAAGTYTAATLTVSHKVIIEGAGGMAAFVPGAAPANGLAQFVTTTDVTFRNIEISGVATPGGVAAAIRNQAGTLTVVNSFIHDNQAGVVADAGSTGSVAIYDTEIARNGTPNGAGANIDVAEIGTLTLRNDWVHDALAGPEVRSRADNTVIDASRISQAAGNGAADLELPDGGVVAVTASVLQKGVNAQATALVHVGGGTVHAGTGVALAGDTFISDQVPATRFVVADAGVNNMSVSNGVFAGGAAGSVQVQNGTNLGASARSGLTVATAAPWGASGAPVPGALTLPAGLATPPARGIMVLRISEDAYRGDARFTIAVDGQQVGGIMAAAASHGAHTTQTFTIAGNFTAAPHSVAVKFVNDQQGGSGEDRNLYVDALSFNGEDMHQSAALTANGTALLATGAVTQPVPVVVNLSETASNGDAQAFIAIDGKVLGGPQMVTASHADGRTQAMSFLPALAPGTHTASITFLNPASTRSLYIDSIDVAGAHYPSIAGTVAPGAPMNFAFTVAPPTAANANLFLTIGTPQTWALPV